MVVFGLEPAFSNHLRQWSSFWFMYLLYKSVIVICWCLSYKKKRLIRQLFKNERMTQKLQIYALQMPKVWKDPFLAQNAWTIIKLSPNVWRATCYSWQFLIYFEDLCMLFDIYSTHSRHSDYFFFNFLTNSRHLNSVLKSSKSSVFLFLFSF